jgi:putative peptide zinc metalloprotease protein
MVLTMVAIHELGHGVVCKHYGGKIQRLGIMFYLASFIFYCDTSSAWNFPDKYKRLLVSLGGPLTTFALLGLAAWGLCVLGGTRSPWEPVLVSFIATTFVGLLMNFNPFIKMDAYYMLIDLSGIPDLRPRSFAFIRDKLAGWLWPAGAVPKREPLDPRQELIYWVYGLCGIFVTGLLVGLSVWFSVHIFLQANHTTDRYVLGAVILVLLFVRLSRRAYAMYSSHLHREYRC